MPITLEQARGLVRDFPKVFTEVEFEYEGLDLVLFNYMVMTREAFLGRPEAVNMRGCVFDLGSGELVSLPFEKFFNVGEHEGVLERDLVFRGRAYEKLDGSMVQVTSYRGRLLIGSRGSFNAYVHESVSEFLRRRTDIVEYILYFEGVTFLFEYLDPLNPVVIVPEVEELVFLNARDVRSGEYSFGVHAGNIPCRVAESRELTPSVWAELRGELGVREGTEGYVLWLEEHGFFVKAKTSWYSITHRAVSMLRPKHFLEAWASVGVDDLLALLRKVGLSDRAAALNAWVEAVDAVVWERVLRAVEFVEGFSGERRELALGLRELLGADVVGVAVFSAVMGLWGSGRVVGVEVFSVVRGSFVGQSRRLTRLVEFCREAVESKLLA